MATADIVPTPYWIAALLTGPSWASVPGSAVELTFAFSTSSTQPGFVPLTAADRAAVVQALAAWSAVAGVRFRLLEGSADPTQAQIRFGLAALPGELAGLATGTPGSTAGVDITLDVAYRGVGSGLGLLGSEGQALLIHEIGHALGLKHPGDYDEAGGGGQAPFLPAAEDDVRFTLMSYNLDATSWNPLFGFAPRGFDIAAAQALYGRPTGTAAASATGAGDSLYRYTQLSTQLGTPLSLIADAGGTDLFDASDAAAAMQIDLRPLARIQAGDPAALISAAGQVAINAFSIIEHAVGSAFADSISGNEVANALSGGAGDDALAGGAGNDTLVAGRGNDTLDGGDGDDLLVGGAGNDQFLMGGAGGAGSDIVIGGAGADELWLASPRADWQLDEMLNGSGEWLLTLRADGTRQHRLLGIEAVVFADAIVALAPTQGAALPPSSNLTLQASEDRTLVASLAQAQRSGGFFFEASLVEPPRRGQAALTADGRLAYTPEPNFSGTDTLRIAFDDGDGRRSEVSVTIQVAAVNDPARARDLLLAVAGGPFTGTLPSPADADGLTTAAYALGTAPLNGSATVQAGGGFTYTPDATTAAAGGWDVFSYRVADAAGAASEHTVRVRVQSGAWVDTSVGQFPEQDAWLQGGALADVLYGGDGIDTLAGAAGADTLFGGSGNDQLRGGNDNDAIDGEAGNDMLAGEVGNDSLYGGAGNDSLDTGAGANLADGGDGDDTLLGGDGADSLYGGAGTDMLRPGAGNDLVVAGPGDESVLGDAGNDSLWGNEGSDTLSGGDGNDQLSGDDFDPLTPDADDRLDGGTGDDALNGNGGDDVLSGNDGSDNVNGRDGNDTLAGGIGNDTMFGEAGDDWIDTGSDDNVADGGAGNDTLQGGIQGDTLFGGEGNDVALGGAGDDTLELGAGDDTGAGGTGVDALYGGAGNDWLIEGASGTYLDGGAGDDTLVLQIDGSVASFFTSLVGGEGTDTLVIRLVSGATLPEGAAAEIAQLRATPGATLQLPLLALATQGFERIELLDATTQAQANTAPVASNGAYGVREDSVLSALLPTAIDLQGDSFSYTLLSDAAQGRVVVQSNGNFSYTPVAHFAGSDSFSFSVVDTLGASHGYTVALKVTPQADAPRVGEALVARNVDEGSAFSFTLPAAAFTDADGDVLAWSARLASGSPLPGWLLFDAATRSFSGTAPRGSAAAGGSYTVQLTARDSSASVNSNFVLTVAAAANTAPVASAGSVAAPENGLLAGALPKASDADGDALSYGITTAPAHGTLQLSPGGSLRYSPDPNFVGVDQLVYSISDGRGGSTSGTLTLNVSGSARNVIGGDTVDRLEAVLTRDSLAGGTGDDVLLADAGIAGGDTFEGGAGFDLVSYAALAGPVSVDLSAGSALRGAAGQPQQPDRLQTVEVVFGTPAGDTLRGADGSAHERGETLRGAGGNDTIDGRGGVDTVEFSGARSGYRVERSGNTLTVTDLDTNNGDEGRDTLTDVERLVFADAVLAFGSRAEEIARVAFVLWTPAIAPSTTLFARGLSYYDVGYDLATMTNAALDFWPQQGDEFVQLLLLGAPGTTRTAAELSTIMANAGGGDAGRVAALRTMADDPATEAALVASGLRETGVVGSLTVEGFGTLFQLWPG